MSGKDLLSVLALVVMVVVAVLEPAYRYPSLLFAVLGTFLFVKGRGLKDTVKRT